MARRNKSRSRRQLGNRSHGKGNIKNKRGKGSKGGKGRAGLGKHKRFWQIKYEGSTAPGGFFNPKRIEYREVSLKKIAESITAGKYKQEAGVFQIDFLSEPQKVKVLGSGEFSFKANVKAHAFSGTAQEKIEKAGGAAVVPE